MRDCHGVDEMENLECSSGSMVPNHIQVVLVWVVALFLLAIVAKSLFTKAGLVLISFKNTGLGFMMGSSLLAMLWPEHF